MFDVFAFHGALRGLCGLDHARIGPDRQNLCQTDMFVPGTGFIQEHKHKWLLNHEDLSPIVPDSSRHKKRPDDDTVHRNEFGGQCCEQRGGRCHRIH